MKNLIIFFQWNYKNEYWNDAFFCMPDFTKKCFLEFIKLFQDDEIINIYICRWSDSYLEHSEFSQGFLYNKNKKSFEFVEKNIAGDFIFNRSSFYFEKGFNDNNLIDFCRDKSRIYNAFPEYCPETKIIENKDKLIKELSDFDENKKIVLKSLTGSCGNDVVITSSKKKLQEYSIFPCLYQEYLDTSDWIPGIFEGKHDLRVIILNGKIVYSLYRTPAKNSDISNLSKWGTLHNIDIQKLPKNIFWVINVIEEKMKDFSMRLYSLDVWYTKNGIKIFELNSSPAIYTHELGAERFHKELYTQLKNKILNIK